MPDDGTSRPHPKEHPGSSSRVIPYDPDAEREVIGAVLATNYPYADLAPSDFHVPAHRDLWQHLLDTRHQPRPRKPADLPDEYRDLARQCADACGGAPNAPARRVLAASVARDLIAVADRVRDLGYENRPDPWSAVNDALVAVAAILNRSTP